MNDSENNEAYYMERKGRKISRTMNGQETYRLKQEQAQQESYKLNLIQDYINEQQRQLDEKRKMLRLWSISTDVTIPFPVWMSDEYKNERARVWMEEENRRRRRESGAYGPFSRDEEEIGKTVAYGSLPRSGSMNRRGRSRSPVRRSGGL